MALESLITDSLNLSVELSPEIGRDGLTEFERISQLLRTLADKGGCRSISFSGRLHTVSRNEGANDEAGTTWSRSLVGVEKCRIVLIPDDERCQRICLEYKLIPSSRNSPSRLDAAFNPTTVLSGNNVHPAAPPPSRHKRVGHHPSSSPQAMKSMFVLGYNLLITIHEQIAKSRVPLFSKRTRRSIGIGRVHVIHAQWSAYLPTPNLSTFLQTITTLYDHTIADGETIAKLADCMGLGFSYYRDERGRKLTGVMLKKCHGKKPVISVVLYDKRKRVADMKQGRSLLPAETKTITTHVRLDITAHSEGVISFVRAAKKTLEQRSEDGFRLPKLTKAFLEAEIKSDVWSLARAIYILSLRPCNKIKRDSFSAWLVPHVLSDNLHVDVVTRFDSKGLVDVENLDDDIVDAWLNGDGDASMNWAHRLAKATNRPRSTIYNRRNRLIEAYGIDIAIPHRYYCDVLYFGPSSVATQAERAAFLKARRERKARSLLKLSRTAEKRFNGWRQRVGLDTFVAKPLSMKVKEATL